MKFGNESSEMTTKEFVLCATNEFQISNASRHSVEGHGRLLFLLIVVLGPLSWHASQNLNLAFTFQQAISRVWPKNQGEKKKRKENSIVKAMSLRQTMERVWSRRCFT